MKMNENVSIQFAKTVFHIQNDIWNFALSHFTYESGILHLKMLYLDKEKFQVQKWSKFLWVRILLRDEVRHDVI